jgi:hypothetical protein
MLDFFSKLLLFSTWFTCCEIKEDVEKLKREKDNKEKDKFKILKYKENLYSKKYEISEIFKEDKFI